VETSTGLITAVDVTAPATPDGSKVAELVETTESLTGADVKRALGDSAYSSRAANEQAEQVDVDLLAKHPNPARGGKYCATDFQISKDRLRVSCPAGHISKGQYRRPDGTIQHAWPRELCGTCPLRENCLKGEGASRRTLALSPDHHARLRRAARAKSEKGRALLKHRIKAEHALAHLKNIGAGVARYCGRAKTKAQWLWSAALANLQRVWTLLDDATAGEAVAA
jgi:hypothetical protein